MEGVSVEVFIWVYPISVVQESPLASRNALISTSWSGVRDVARVTISAAHHRTAFKEALALSAIFRARLALTSEGIVRKSIMATCAVNYWIRDWMTWSQHLKVAWVTVRRAWVTFTSVMVCSVARIAVGAVYHTQRRSSHRLHELVLACPTVLGAQLAYSQWWQLRVNASGWDLDRDQGSDIIAGGAVGEGALGECTSVPLAVGARIGSSKHD